MKHQFMKRRFHAAMLAVGSLFTLTVPATAQEPSKATIPFDFKVGNTSLAAGDYTIEQVSVNSREMLALRDSSGKRRVIIQGVRKELTGRYSEPHLVFTKYAQGAVLSELWLSATEAGVSVPKTRLEKELMLGSGGAGMQSVAVASGK